MGALRTIVINSSNYVPNSRNKFVYKFPGSADLTGCKVGLQSISLYNSTFNITSEMGNNQIVVHRHDGEDFTIKFPNSFMAASDMNAYIQQQCVLNGYYLINKENGNFVYFIQILENPPLYAIQLNTFTLPTDLGTTYIYPNPKVFELPTIQLSPSVTFNQAFGNLIGLPAGRYPKLVYDPKDLLDQKLVSQITDPSGKLDRFLNYGVNNQFISTFTPKISPVDSYVLAINLVNSPLSIPANIFFNLPFTAPFGQLISLNMGIATMLTICPNKYANITIDFLDQLMNPLILNDYEVVITLVIEDNR